jgi:hypothetical protein
MPIREFLNGQKFDPEVIRVMGLAFEIARTALQLEDRNGAADQALAGRIIQLAQQGERDPDRLSGLVLAELRTPPPRV